MEDISYKELSNTEIKLKMEQLKNEFDAKRNQILDICDQMKKLEDEYLLAENELKLRKNILA
jgi:hypothetical protein